MVLASTINNKEGIHEMSGRNLKKLNIFMLVGIMVFINVACDTGTNSSENGVVNADEAYIYNDIYTYSVTADVSGDYQLRTPDNQKLEVYKVNGIELGADESVSGEVKLNKGINSISLKNASNVEGVKLDKAGSNSEFGAKVNYISYELEEGETNTQINEEDRTYLSFSAEASNRKYVELSETDDYVTVELQEPANAFVLRYSIPDSEDGTGIDSTLNMYIDEEKQSINLTSKYAWLYGSYPFNNNPSEGMAHRFFDDVRVKLDKTYPAGTKIKFIKEAENDAEFYLLDLLEAEEIDAPLTKPENAVSIVDYGATPNDGTDDSDAIYAAIADAAENNKEVFIPEGEFNFDNEDIAKGIVIKDNGITIRGAGMWHSVLKGDNKGFFIRAQDTSFYDFSLIGDVQVRRDVEDPSAFAPEHGARPVTNIVMQNIWMEHWKVGLWSDAVNGIFMNGTRIRNTFADGVNFCAGTRNSVAIHNDLRNTGDDGFAMWSRGVASDNNKLLRNTISLPILANTVAIYGGSNIQIKHNWLKDTVYNGSGINISSNFEPEDFEGLFTISDNLVERAGSRNDDANTYAGGIWFNVVQGHDIINAEINVENNKIYNSSYSGISFSNFGVIENTNLNNNEVMYSQTYGIAVDQGVKGSISTESNNIEHVGIEEVNNEAGENFEINGITNGNEE